MAIVTDHQTFNTLFAASRDPRLAELHQLKTQEGYPDVAARTAAAQKLYADGLIVNEGVDISGMDPFFFMRWLGSMKMVWHEAMFQQQPASLLDYQDASKAWKNSVKISLDDKDYPPFTTPPDPVDHSNPIGKLESSDPVMYEATPAFFVNGSPRYKEGQASTPYTSPKGETLYARWYASLFAPQWVWMLQ